MKKRKSRVVALLFLRPEGANAQAFTQLRLEWHLKLANVQPEGKSLRAYVSNGVCGFPMRGLKGQMRKRFRSYVLKDL